MKNVEEDKPTIFHALILCIWCMPSIHCLVGYILSMLVGIVDPMSGTIWLLYPIAVGGTSITAGLVWTIHETILSYKEKIDKEYEYLDNMEKLTHFDILDRKKEHQRRENFQAKKINHER